ncbi:hypothetical protein Pd630_LPD07757 [Rhodococcus opacus PD630]|nr:hypothetical protein Pd630_LPD07757 [Rhodococcus opacus PD630]
MDLRVVGTALYKTLTQAHSAAGCEVAGVLVLLGDPIPMA